MADVTITAADVRPLPGAIVRRFTAGGSINAGEPVYVNAADAVSQADGSAVSTSFAIGVMVATGPSASSRTIAASGDPVDVALFGPVAGYSTNMAAGTVFYVDDDAGVIADAAGTKDTIIGIGLSTSVMLVHPQIIDLS